MSNQQYQAFVEDGGYQPAHWWEDLKRTERDESRWPQPNRPVTNVNWYEAVAYTRWLDERLGLKIRLPSELEWEQAARGTQGQGYPWGEGYRSGFANVDETGNQDGPWDLQQTTAVGLYPQGDSADGVSDLAGTVWEWCLNKYDRPDVDTPDTSGVSWVVRGGTPCKP